MTTAKFPLLRSFFTSMGFFSINIAWAVYSIYVPIFLRNNLQPLLGNLRVLNTLVGIIMVLDNLAAIILQPIIGNLSDRTWLPKLGRRMPFLILGIPFAALFFGLIGTFEETLVLLLVAICGFNICMAFYNAPALSLLPDTLGEEQMSYGNSILNAVGGLANIVGLLLSAYLYAISHQLAFWVIALTMIVCLVLLLITVREKADLKITTTKEKSGLFSSIKKVFKERNLLLLLLLLAVFTHNAAYQIAQTFFSSYADELLNFPGEKAALILGAFLVFQILLSILGGALTKQIGVMNALLLGLLLFLAGFLPLSIISYLNPSLFGKIITLNNNQFWSWEFYFSMGGILLMAFGWLLLFMNLLLAVWNLAPRENVGTYTAFYYVFWNLAAIVSPLIAGGFFDFIGYLTGINGLQTLFLLVCGIYFITLIVLIIIKIKLNLEFHKNLHQDTYLLQQIDTRELPLRFLPLLFFLRKTKNEDFKFLKEQRKSTQREKKQALKLIRKKALLKETALDALTWRKQKRQQIREKKEYYRLLKKEYHQQIKDLKNALIMQRIKDLTNKKNRRTAF